MIKSLIAGMLTILALQQPTNVDGNNTGYIFLGDSRTVGMDWAVDIENTDGQFVVAKVGMGYNWMQDTAMSEIEEIVSENDEYTDWVLITNLGVNDLGNCDKYINAYEELSEVFNIYVVSVNPCDGTSSYLNDNIIKFNDAMKALDYVTYVDTHTSLCENGFGTNDGLHYKKDTYRYIYDTIVSEVIGTDGTGVEFNYTEQNLQ